VELVLGGPKKAADLSEALAETGLCFVSAAGHNAGPDTRVCLCNPAKRTRLLSFPSCIDSRQLQYRLHASFYI
jgi:hypothetical protein